MMRKKILTLAIFVGATLLLTATGVLAASPAVSNSHPVGEEAGAIPTISPTVSITNPVAAMIADFFDLDVAQVQAWHDEGLGYGEIARAYFLAELSDKSVAEVMALYQGGLGWGEVAKTLGLAPGNKGRNLGSIMSGRAVTETQTMSGTVGTRGRGPKETPPGWDLGNGLDLGRGHGRGHNKSPALAKKRTCG